MECEDRDWIHVAQNSLCQNTAMNVQVPLKEGNLEVTRQLNRFSNTICSVLHCYRYEISEMLGSVFP